jgi:hypothetical protein
VGEQEPAPVVFGDMGVVDDLDPQLALEPTGPATGSQPVVVVSSHEEAANAALDETAERTEDRGVAWGRLAVVEPEVEEIAEDVDGLAGEARIEKGDERTLLGAFAGGRLAPQVSVRQEIDGT